mmetsp:Transcript_61075/g.120244  ORF Transcript_61075/g.120244 Transcript_61075/m.120244 type:complete len:440 (+) Transcript_61075:48-1367(+)
MLSEYYTSRLPLFYVFLSGIGFSLQTLVIKVLSENGFHASFQVIFFRGVIQFILASIFVYYDEERQAGRGPKLFGDSYFVKTMLFLRSFIGYGGIAFSFLAVELIPIGDATVLLMMSPLLTAILSFLILGEPWRMPEFVATVISLVGVVLVAKPPAIFGGNAPDSASFYKGVVYGLISAISAAFAYLFVRILGTTAKMPWSNVCFCQAIAQMLMAFPCLYIFGQKLHLELTLFQAAMMLTGGGVGAVSQILMTIGMQREKSAAATGMRMSDVAFGYLWQVLFTSDALSFLSLGGAFLVSCSVMIIIICKDGSTSAGSSQLPGAAADMKNKSLELTEIRNAFHSLADSFDLEEGFQDSEDEDAVRNFDFDALHSSLEDTFGESDVVDDGAEGQKEDAPDLDLSIHGEHGGLLNAQKRSHTGDEIGFLGKVSLPIFSGTLK